MLVFALYLVVMGAWAIGSEDLQGGRDAVGALWLVAAVFPTVIGVWIVWSGRRRR